MPAEKRAISAHANVDTAPAWLHVVATPEQLRPDGRFVINAIRKETADQPVLAEVDCAKHLWRERTLTTVPNVAATDIAEFLPLAAAAERPPRTQTFALEDTNRALVELKNGSICGATVLCP
ncbi:MAG: hypothetical protein AAF417_01090 [Pseudomonadota bacterium]